MSDKLTPFSFINQINTGKLDIMVDDVVESQYVPFVVNRTLSYFKDTVLIANEMNINHHLDNKLQFHFLLAIVRKRKRFTKWGKADVDPNLVAVKQYYGYNDTDAAQALSLLTDQQIATIKGELNRGGLKYTNV